jgi:hypothetical protein
MGILNEVGEKLSLMLVRYGVRGRKSYPINVGHKTQQFDYFNGIVRR